MKRLDDFSLHVEIPDVLRMIGSNGENSEINQLVATGVELCKGKVRPQVIYGVYPFQMEGKCLSVSDCTLQSKWLVERLSACDRLLVTVMTCGEELDKQIQDSMHEDLMMGYILDSIGSLAVQSLSDLFWNRIKEEADSEGLSLTSYHSPGSYDFALDQQTTIFQLLQPNQIGVSLTDSYLMQPRKSVSGLIGLGTEIPGASRSHDCDQCDMVDCFLRTITIA